jgi:hypothetical protein
VAARSYWGVTPRESIEAECAKRGRQAVVDGCARLLTGGEADTALIVALGRPAARGLLDAGLPKGQLYWLRVWGARGLLWVWEPEWSGQSRCRRRACRRTVLATTTYPMTRTIATIPAMM